MPRRAYTYRCPQCRTGRMSGALMVLHMMDCPRPMCHCMAYTYPHRPLSGECFLNPDAQVVHASRAGTPDDELLDVQIDVALSMRGKTAAVCPF
ncbi:MAG: hypothetical protein JWQ72_2354 [Polaromonas sp.]|nr:hypothetical protein [Polaromonas sp.]